MRKVTSTTLLLFGLTTSLLRADATWVYAVQLTAETQASPPQITLHWEADPNGAASYTVSRKLAWESEWGSATMLPGSATSFVDQNVGTNSAYEYQVVKAGTAGYTGYGYIYAGLANFFQEDRGKLILIVDDTYAAQLATELARLQSDLIGDGWTVIRHDVARNASPASVKALISGDYWADSSKVQAVFLFGHVPVLRCGDLNVDGHQARAMPADAYYGDMDTTWDDPSYLPSDVELMVGRVDLANMPGAYVPAPWPSELELLRNYLNKDHNWRHKQVSVPQQALMGDRFGDLNGQAFSASGYRAFPLMVGPGKTVMANVQDNAPAEQRWSSLLGAGSYLWAYGCGGGSFTSMSGLGTHGNYGDIISDDLIRLNAKAVFFMMAGSWLVDWDTSDNIMRAALATPSLGLTCSWSGRPHWFYHHFALGEPIGYSARLTMNNSELYKNQVNYAARGVHIALMGDPTLRLHPVAPPENVSATRDSGGVAVLWSASPDPVLGYNLYRANSPQGPFTRLNNTLITGTSYVDVGVAPGNHTYMVRALKLEQTPSGSYYNPSQGVFANVK